MRKNLLKEKLLKGEPCRGIWMGAPSVLSARLLARLPVDWLVIDVEHAPIGVELMAQITATIVDARGPAPLVRLSQSSNENVKYALDAGAYGIIAPMMNTCEEVEQLVAWAKYPPLGQRSYGGSYAGLAFDQTMPHYLRRANDQTLIIIQIESKAALANLDAMFAVPGVDLVFVGPVDLAISLGLDPVAENPHPVFQDAIRQIQQAAQAHDLPLGIYCSNGKAAAERIRQGFLLVNVTSDTDQLKGGSLAELEASK